MRQTNLLTCNKSVTFIFVALFLSFLSICTFPAYSQSRVKVYPTSIRLDKGKTRSITAVAFDSAGNYLENRSFIFSNTSGNAAVATVRRSPEGNMEDANSHFSNNLGEISGLASGTATFNATLNGVTSNLVTVTVVDPADAPLAVIAGDSQAGSTVYLRVGEALEVNAESSQGVALAEWFWGDGDRTGNLLSATHAYLQAGNYNLRLKVSNTTGQSNEQTVSVVVTNQPPPTNSFTVSTISELLAAYNQCTGGEEIIIPAGTVMTGEVQLPARNFSDFVTIRSSAAMPAMTERSAPNQNGLVTFRGAYANQVPFQILNRANKIRLSGLKFEPFGGSPDYVRNYYLLQIGEAFGQTAATDNPTQIIVDHCVVNPPDNISVVHAVLNDGYKVSLIGNWLGNIKTFGGQDSQAVFGLDGRGAHVYNNNFFEAASENIIYGGAYNRIEGMVPSNIEFRRCMFTKRLSWRGAVNSVGETINVKNLFETKNMRRVYVEGSILENHWDAGRSQYYAINLKSSTGTLEQDQGSLWSISEDIVFENDRISHANGAVTVARDFLLPSVVYEPLKPNHIVFTNILFDDLTQGRFGSRTWGFYLGGVDDFSLRHVTMIDADDTPDNESEALMIVNHIANFRLNVTDSILPLNYYSIRNSCASGTGALNVGTAGWFNVSNISCDAANGSHGANWSFDSNVLPVMQSGFNAERFPTNNSYPNNYSEIGMNAYRRCSPSVISDPCNSNVSDFALRPDSVLKNRASDNTDPGVNSELLSERIRCTIAGETSTCISGVTPTPTPTPTPTATPTPTPTPTPVVCTPATTVTEGNLLPGGIVSFGVSSGLGSVTVDHVNTGTGLQSLTVVGTPTNAIVTIPAFTPGTTAPVVLNFIPIAANQSVDFTLRAASTFHAANIRVRCGIPQLKSEQK